MSGAVAGEIRPDDGPPAPDHLSPAAAARWCQFVATWALHPAELLLLEEGLAAWDRIRACREILAREGPVSVNPSSGNPKRNPAAKELNDSLTQMRNCFKQLELPTPETT